MHLLVEASCSYRPDCVRQSNQAPALGKRHYTYHRRQQKQQRGSPKFRTLLSLAHCSVASRMKCCHDCSWSEAKRADIQKVRRSFYGVHISDRKNTLSRQVSEAVARSSAKVNLWHSFCTPNSMLMLFFGSGTVVPHNPWRSVSQGIRAVVRFVRSQRQPHVVSTSFRNHSVRWGTFATPPILADNGSIVLAQGTSQVVG